MERAKGQVSAALRVAVAHEAPWPPASPSLGLKGIPERIARLSPGMIYSLACDQQAVRLPLAAGALAATIGVGKNCVLVTPADPAMFLRKALLAGFDLSADARSGALTVLQLAPDPDKYMFRAGPQAFLAELEGSTAGPGGLIVLDQADPLFMLSDPRESAEAAEAYNGWAAQHEHTLVALFAPSSITPREYLALRRIAENFAGFAVARSSWDGGTLDVRHWFGPEGASPRETFALRLHNSGIARTGASPSAREELPPVDTVVCVDGAIAPSGRVDWQDVASAAEGLQACRRSEAATLVLPFRRTSEFRGLCETVAALRAMARPELRVVVRESAHRLRAAQALALLRLGASAVMPTDMPDVAARRMLEHLKGVRHARPFEHDLDMVLDETAQALTGPTGSAAMFCEAVEVLLASADGFDFDSALVRVSCEGDRAALLSRVAKSGRDLVCVSKGGEVWLLLFGCAKDGLGAVMQRLAPTGNWTAEFVPERILSELEHVRGA
jgi:hypothetical protein